MFGSLSNRIIQNGVWETLNTAGMQEKNKFSLVNQAMERLIQEQSFALQMEAWKRMQRFNMEDKVVSLLNELWDKMCVNSTARRPVEFTCEDHGMEFSVGE